MKTKLLVFLAGLLCANLAQAQEPQVIPGQFIVKLKETSAKPVIAQQQRNNNRDQKFASNNALRNQAMSKLNQVKQRKNIPQGALVNEYADVLVGFTAKLNPQQVEALKADPDVEGVYPDYVINLSKLNTEANTNEVNAAAQTVPCAVTNAGGFADGSTKSTWIWILGTGIDLDHPDLNVITNSTYARSFIDGQTIDDGNGHGTRCAGIAAAKNNGIGIVGVSAGAKVVPIKVLSNTGSGSWSALLLGLNHVAQYDIPNDVVNLAVGSYGIVNCENSNPTLRDAIRNLGNAGTWVVMGAGSDAGNAALSLPGCINGNRIITVGAITCNNSCTSFSNWGRPPVDYVAVGVSVYTTSPGGSYITISGTAIASAVVAGVIHARGAAPACNGYATCGGLSYCIARR